MPDGKTRMRTQRVFERCLIPIYIVIELCILVAIKLPVRYSCAGTDSLLMLLSIAFNALVALYFLLAYGRHTPYSADLIALALYITVIGDLFLTYLGEPFFIPGVFSFCIVETLYAIFLKPKTTSIVFRMILFGLLIAAAIPTGNISVLNVLAILNIAILAGNVLDAWLSKDFDPGLLFKLGITLFFCCDLSLGLSTLLSGAISNIMSAMIWVFYIPSQVLLTLCYARRRKSVSTTVN